MTGWSKAEKLHVEHVRNSGQRGPQIYIAVGEGSGDRVPGQAPDDLGVLKNVKVIIVIDKTMTERFAEHGPDEEKQLEGYTETCQWVSEPIFHTSLSGVALTLFR